MFYWSGDKPGFQKTRPGHAWPENPKTYDGWRPIYQKPNGEIDSFIKESNLINEQLQDQLKNDLKIEELNSQVSSGEVIKPSSEAQDIHNELLRVIKEKKEIETQKKIIELKLSLIHI